MDWQDDGEGYPEFREPSPEEEADWAAYLAWEERERASGREHVPEPWELEGPALSLSLGDAASLDPALLAAIGAATFFDETIDDQWAQDKAADALRPGPVLAALAQQAAAGTGRLSDDELLGALGAACRLENWAGYLQTVLISEFGRRRQAQREDAAARKIPKDRRPGEYADAELAMELVSSVNYAADRIEEASDLTARLPATLAGLRDGSIDAARASVIHRYTVFLTGADAARADEILAAAAPGLRWDQLARKAAALEMKLDPAAVKRRRERAAKDGRRVEVRREASGNAAIAGRELDTADVQAAKANIDALAVALRRAGAPGTLQHLRARVLTELLQGRDPLNLTFQPTDTPGGCEPGAPAEPAAPAGPALLGPGPFGPGPGPGPAGPGSASPGPGPTDTDPIGRPDAPGDMYPVDGAAVLAGDFPDNGYTDEADDDDENPDQDGDSTRRGPAGLARTTAPLPATINLLVPVGTLFGWSDAPAEAGGWDLLDAVQTRDLLTAAARHPATRWCWTLLAPDGTAAAHACAAGRHPWPPPHPKDQPGTGDQRGPKDQPGDRDQGGPGDQHVPGDQHGPRDQQDPRDPAGPGGSHARWDRADQSGSRAGPDSAQAAQLAAFLASLGATLRPIARGSCEHTQAEDRYTPSRKLKHLIQARTARCPAPGCDAQAACSDADHTIPWPAGPTDQCNLSSPCRRHHRVKQAPGWKLQQPEPGLMVWTLPSGRVHATTPTVYDSVA